MIRAICAISPSGDIGFARPFFRPNFRLIFAIKLLKPIQNFPKNIIRAKVFASIGTKQDHTNHFAGGVDVAVRSSATAEDLADASFAGQQESYLNVTGEYQLLESIKKCFSSLFTDRAISYRVDKGFDQLSIALSVGVQKMVRSDEAASGVMFTIDTESGFSRCDHHQRFVGTWGKYRERKSESG